MDTVPSFQQRFGLSDKQVVESDFPLSARKALMYLFHQMVDRQYVSKGWQALYAELARSAREDFQLVDDSVASDACAQVLVKMPWHAVYSACERIYKGLLTETGHWEGYNGDKWEVDLPIDQVRAHYSEEINNVLSEENLGYQFVDGLFIKPGRVQTQRNINKVTSALADPRLLKVRRHYNKAMTFFSERERPDYENCVKEAVCALEAAIEILSGTNVSKDFAKEVTKLSGSETGKVPGPVAQAIIKIHAYRGAGQGVSHGTIQGAQVSRHEAELVLSTVAAFITYLVDFYQSQEPEIPF